MTNFKRQAEELLDFLQYGNCYDKKTGALKIKDGELIGEEGIGSEIFEGESDFKEIFLKKLEKALQTAYEQGRNSITARDLIGGE